MLLRAVDGSGVERLEPRTLLASAVAGVGTGLVGNYFSDLNLTNLAATKVDQTVNFQFGGSVPGGGVNSSSFSARWSGKVQAQYDETYTFYTSSDEPVRLWVNGQELINDWTAHAQAEDSGTIALSAGEFYDIKLEYSDNTANSTLALKWSSASTPEQVIPAAQLYDSGGWVSGNWLDENIGGGSGFALGGASSYTVQSGAGTFGSQSTDQFHFLYQTLNGDGTIIAQLSLGQNDAWPAEAGVMFRDSSDPGAKFVAMGVGVSSGGVIQYRSTAGAAGAAGAAIWPDARWVKLVRDGSFFKAYLSKTGTDSSWRLAGTTFVEMGRTVEVGLAVAGGSSPVLSTTFTNVSITPTVQLGAGLDQVKDYTLGNVFVDVAKQMREPQTPSFGADVPVDSIGWPMADFASIFMTGFTNTAHIYNGTYKLSFQGQANVTGWAAGPTTVQNVVYNAGTNTTTADVIINATESMSQWYVGLIFKNTKRTPTSALGSGVTNIKMIRPGYAPNTTQVFTNEYLAHLKQFTTLRFMDFTQTNNNPVTEWSDRAKITDARQSTDKGVAWEYVIQLANQLKKDVWINVPEGASDDYIRNLAQLFKKYLSPDLTVYIEYSNEVWNGSFQQAQDDLAQAIQEVNDGDSPLNNDGVNNQYYWMWRRVGMKLKDISDIFASVYGQAAINRQIRPVLANQFANPEVVKQQLEFLDRTYGSPGNYIYGIAEAPYFGAGSAIDNNPSATVDDYLNGFTNSIASSSKLYYTFNSFATRYGLKDLAYEGGPDTFGPGNIAQKEAASLDPRMTNIVVQYLDSWYSQGGALFNWFQAGPTNYETAFGTWGLSNAIDNLTSPKIMGTITVVDGPKTSLTYGIPVPATWDARQSAGSSTPYANQYEKSPGTGNSIDYFVRAAQGGNYKLILRGGTSGSNEQVRVTVNSTQRTMTLQNTGSSTTFADNNFGTIALDEGENLIRLTSMAESSGWNLSTMTVCAPVAPNNPPTVAQAAKLVSIVNGKSASLSVLGADDGGEANLTYSWRVLGVVPGQVSWSANGSNAAKNTVATFTQAGAYTLECTIFDGTSAVTSTVGVLISPVGTSIVVSPGSTFAPNGATQQYSATLYDQFGTAMFNQPTFTWSLDSGSVGTISTSGLYTAPASGTGMATVRASSGSISGTATIQVQVPRTPENPANVVNGIDYRYFEGLWSSVPNFDTMTPIKTGSLSNFDIITPRNVSDGYGLQFTGYVTVPATGTYTFYTSSDDGSNLYIGNTLVVNNDGLHGTQEKSGQIVLAAGTHAIKVNFFENAGGEALTVSYSGPGVSKQAIPGSALWHNRHAPTVASPATVIPYPVPGTQAAVSVLGADDGGSGEAGLTYTWSTTSKPNGAPDPAFSVNGNNAAKNSVVTFGQAGTYNLLVTISNGFGTVTSSVNVVVNQTLQTLQITPTQQETPLNSQQQINASGTDQFGKPMTTMPGLSWSATGGSIDASGRYVAPSYGGRFTITASYGSLSASNYVDVVDTAPQITSGPTATLDAQGKTATLHATAIDDGGAQYLSLNWYVVSEPAGAADPTFSSNGEPSSGDSVVTFSKVGLYSLVLSVYDGWNSTDVPLDVNVPVVATSIGVAPTNATIQQGATLQMSATGYDQFGAVMAPQPSFAWSVTGGGSIDSGGLFTGSTIGTPTVTAKVGTLAGSTIVTVAGNGAPTIAQAASANPSSSTSTTTNLSVLGADDGGEANLKYTWSVTSKPTGAATPTFNINGTNAAKNAVATYLAAGSYTFMVTVSDGSKTATSSVSTTVTQKTTSVVVTPGSASVQNGASQQFSASARDQFGSVMAVQPTFTWSVQSTGSPAGTVSSTGLYTAPSTGTPTETVQASTTGTLSGTVVGSAAVTVIPSANQQALTSDVDIGAQETHGGMTFSNGTYTVQAGGWLIGDPADEFHYVYKQMTGDSTLIARVASVGNTNPRAMAGLMFRQDLSDTSFNASLVISPDQLATFFARYTTGTTVASRYDGPYGNGTWIKMVRSGNNFLGYLSPDGVTWTLFDQRNVTMGTSYYVGLAVCSSDDTVLNTSTFDHVSVSSGAQMLVAQAVTTTPMVTINWAAINGATAKSTSDSSTTLTTSDTSSTITATGAANTSKVPVIVNVPTKKTLKLTRAARETDVKVR